jgi:hypothetical protein
MLMLRHQIATVAVAYDDDVDENKDGVCVRREDVAGRIVLAGMHVEGVLARRITICPRSLLWNLLQRDQLIPVTQYEPS